MGAAGKGGTRNILAALNPLTFATSGGMGFGKNFQRFADDITGRGAARDSKTALEETGRQNQYEADRIKREIGGPQVTQQSDNFLAKKAKNLANLRLGIASTMTGASAGPMAGLLAPTLGGKKTLGS